MAAALFLGACHTGNGPYLGHDIDPEPGHLRWCVGAVDSLDPASFLVMQSALRVFQLFDAPFVFGPNLEMVPSLATSWEASADQRSFTLHLRNDARFSNGRRITAEDLRYSLVRSLLPRTGSPWAESLWRVRHGKAYSSGTARRIVADVPPFHAGEVVQLKEAPPRKLATPTFGL